MLYPILNYGSEEQKQEWLPQLQSGQAIGCFGLTEASFGPNPGDVHVCAGTRGAGYSMARKPGSPTAAWPTSRRCGPRLRMRSAVFWFRMGRRILSAGDSRQTLDVRVGHRGHCFERLPGSGKRDAAQGQGLRALLSCLTQARFGIGWGVIGAAMDCYDTERSYSVTRRCSVQRS